MPTRWPRRCARPKKPAAPARRRHRPAAAPYTTVTDFVVADRRAGRPAVHAGARRLPVAEAFEVPLSFQMTPAHHQRHDLPNCRAAPRFLSMPWDVRRPTAAAAALLHLGRHCGDAAQPLRLPPPLSAGRAGRSVSSAADGLLRRPDRLLIERLKAAAAGQLGHHGWSPGSAGRATTSTPARRITSKVVWCVAVLTPTLLVALATGAGPLQPGAGRGLRRAGAVLHAGLPPVQPLLHRPARCIGPRRRRRVRRLLAEWLHLDASELPQTEVLRHVVEHRWPRTGTGVFGVFFWFIVLLGPRPGPSGRGAVP